MDHRPTRPDAAADARRGRSGAGAWAALALLAACGLALALRALGYEWTFVGDGEVVLAAGDGHYHARRALWNLVHFPSFLIWDAYINHPDGAYVPQPFLPDLLVAAIAVVLGGGERTLEHVLAWWAPLAGALTPVPVFLAARRVAARGTALGAATLVGLLPILATASQVGDADHHAAVVLVGATLLATCLAVVDPRLGERRRAAMGALLALLRVVIALSWGGSLLYLALVDAAILVAATLGGRRDLLRVEAASASASALILLPIVLSQPTPAGGDYSAIDVSRLHVCAMFAAGLVAGALWALETRRPAPGVFARIVRLAGAGTAVAALALLLPGLRTGLLPGLRFVGAAEESGVAITELLPLFSLPGRPAGQPAVHYFGLYAYLIPLAPLAALWLARSASVRAPALVLAGWAGVLGALALWQVRFGADFAPAGCIGFALLLAGLSDTARSRLRLPRPFAVALALALGAALLWTPGTLVYAPAARASLAALAAPPGGPDRALATPSGSLVRFLQEVRRTTPETSGYLDEGRPEYGILCAPRIGHPLHYVARRASPADGFLDALDPEKLRLTRGFFALRSEAEALALAERLEVRYVISMFFPGLRPGTLGAQLQFGDGRESGAQARLQHFRLVTEGPRGGRPLSDLIGMPRPERVVPYKLFEIVRGALLELRGAPHTPVVASLQLRTPLGRRFVYEARETLGADGAAQLRLPYASRSAAPVRPLGAWRVRVGDAEQTLHVSEQQVREGATLSLPASPRDATPDAR